MAIAKLTNVRIIFPELWEPKAPKGGVGENKPKYGCQIHIDKSDALNLEKCKAAMKEAAKAKFGDKWELIYQGVAAAHRVPLRDGLEKAQVVGYSEIYFFNASRRPEDGPPKVVDCDGKTFLTPGSGKPYGGCYVNAYIDFWAQKHASGDRINAGLIGIQFVKDGDAFGGRPAADVEFDDLSNQGDGGTAPAAADKPNPFL